MIITFKKKDSCIRDLQDWEKVGNPKSSVHWKPGRSSMEMAKFALSNSFEDAIKKVLDECNIKEQNFVCEPEAKNSLGKGFNRGGCRNHDLLMIGEDCLIGVEAKVSESFDKDIDKVLEEQTPNYSNKSDTRAYKLIKYLWQKDNIPNVGYQLFTSAKGTLVASEKNNFKKCILLVIVFNGNVEKERDYEKRIERNNKHFQKFLSGIGANDEGLISRTENNQEINCWIKKLEITISDQYSF